MDVDASRIWHLVDFLKKSGATPQVVSRVLQESRISEAEIAPTVKKFDARKEARFIRGASDVLRDVTFGAKAGLEYQTSSSLTAYINKYSRDLKEVMENSSRFHEIIDPSLVFSLRVSGNHASFEGEWKDASFARYHRRTEFLLFGALARMRTIAQTNFFPIEMRFQHQVGKVRDAFQKIAGFPVVFGSESTEIILSHSALTLPVPTYDPSLKEHLLEYGKRILAEHHAHRQGLRAKVEGLITASLPGRIVHAEEAAASLGMSARTFARRLRNEGVSYRAIVEDLRSDLAQTFVKSGMNLAEITFALGYSDQAAFSTAFKRWTGLPPRTFRERAARSV